MTIDTKAIRAAADFCEMRGMVVELDPSAVIALLNRLEAAEAEVLEPVAWWVVNKTTDEKFATTRPDDWNNLNWLKYPLFTSPPPPTEVPLKQIAEALRQHGLTLIKKANGYDVMKLGNIEAQEQAAVRQKAGLK